MAAITGTVIAAASLAKGVYDSAQAAKAAKNAGKGGQVDIDALNQQTKTMAIQNAKDSKALEMELNPEVARLRTGSVNGVNAALDQGAQDDSNYRQLLNDHLNKELPTPLLNAAIQKAQTDLAQGGKIDPETQNLITRHALATAGSVGGGNLGLGRDITARDLGTSSLALSNQRLQNASQLGGQELQLGQANAGNWLNNFGALQNVGTNSFTRSLNAAQLANSMAAPVVGLDPGTAASVAIGNSNASQAAAANAANLRGQQSANYLNFAGQALGAYGAYKGASGTTNTASAPAYNTGMNGYGLDSGSRAIYG